MDFWFSISLLMIKTMSLALLNPFFWLVVFIVLLQYRRIVFMEKKLFGQSINNIWKQTIYSVIFGIMGGIFGSIFLLLLGISLDCIGIAYLWPVAILLLLLNPRFLCFAYAGGIISAVSLLIRFLLPFWPNLGDIALLKGLMDIHLPSLLALIGILHLTESFLIFISGHRGASPIYLKAPSGELLGGYSMQRFWPLPLMGLWGLVVAESSEIFVGGVLMPEWWPLLGSVMNPVGAEKLIYLMVPLVAGLGYSDLALSSYPRDKRIKTAGNLALYSVLLSLLAISAVFIPLMIIPAALLAPLGHEFLIRKGNKEEFSRPPLFNANNSHGLTIIAVIPDSPAEKAGLQGGDWLMEVNNQRIDSEIDFWNILRVNYYRVLFKIKRSEKEIKLPVQIYPWPVNQLGIIFAPGRLANVYVEMKHSSLLKNIRRRFSPGGS
ncbi:MAG: PDZ domain-containing protein [Dethiobacter sp.]|nr:MAG: PDZ domain-containing protein [Dethiobacter sp.]